MEEKGEWDVENGKLRWDRWAGEEEVGVWLPWEDAKDVHGRERRE